MRADLSTLFWLKRKQLKSLSRYWLPLMGVGEDESPFYLVYVALFWLVWGIAVWGFVTESIREASRFIPQDAVSVLPPVIPALVMLVYLLFQLRSLFINPLKVSSADMAYLVTSPVSRSMLTLTYFAYALLIPLVVISVGSTLVAMLYGWVLFPADEVYIIGLMGFVMAILIVTCLIGWAWLIGLLRYRIKLPGVVWIILVGLLTPVPVYALAQVWWMSLGTLSSPTILLAVAGLTAITLVLLGIVAGGVHLSAIADESHTFAQIQQLGVFSRIYARAVIERIKRQSRLLLKTHLRYTLPTTDDPLRTLWYRSLLSLVRLSPQQLLRLIGQGVFYTGAVVFLTATLGWRPLPVWLIIIILFWQVRPSGLIGTYGQDSRRGFVAQFLPADRLQLFIAGSFFPVVISISSGLIVVMLSPFASLSAILLLILTTIALALFQALELKKVEHLVRYEHSAIFYGVVVIASGLLSSNPWTAIVVATVFVMGALSMLED